MGLSSQILDLGNWKQLKAIPTPDSRPLRDKFKNIAQELSFLVTVQYPVGQDTVLLRAHKFSFTSNQSLCLFPPKYQAITSSTISPPWFKSIFWLIHAHTHIYIYWFTNQKVAAIIRPFGDDSNLQFPSFHRDVPIRSDPCKMAPIHW